MRDHLGLTHQNTRACARHSSSQKSPTWRTPARANWLFGINKKHVQACQHPARRLQLFVSRIPTRWSMQLVRRVFTDRTTVAMQNTMRVPNRERLVLPVRQAGCYANSAIPLNRCAHHMFRGSKVEHVRIQV